MMGNKSVIMRLAMAGLLVIGGSQAQTFGSSEQRAVIAAANPYASEAGYAMLERGGSAVDAAIAAQMVLTLVEPQSSGLGGGAFLLHHDHDTGELTSWDGRERAPLAVDTGLFLDPDGTRMQFWDAVVGGRSVGVPGLLAMLAKVHQTYGRLDWAILFEPAIALAEGGFIVSPRLAAMVKDDQGRLLRQTAARSYFYHEDGSAIAAGERLVNPELARTLRLIAEDGPDAFYQGAIARDIVAAVQGASWNPGALSMQDMASYQAVRREPVCSGYRIWDICGQGPPSSGGVAVGQILGMLQHFDLTGGWGAEAAHLLASASLLAFADRNHYLGDQDFVEVPVAGLLDREYLRGRARLIDHNQSPNIVAPGSGLLHDSARISGSDYAMPSTSHLVVRDRMGNLVSMTSSIESAFGSRLMVRGFLLNNQLTDFSFVPEQAGQLVANRVQPGKRPRSSMAPTIVYQGKEPVLVIGSPGGSRIIGYVAQAILAYLEWGFTLDQA
ncbi:MAG: gamma-glutamyltransferase, partial [Pseudomonadota bacterium]